METKMTKVYNDKYKNDKNTKIGIIENVKNYIPVTDDVSQFFLYIIFNCKVSDKELKNIEKSYSKHRYVPRFIFTNFETKEEITKYIKSKIGNYKHIFFEKYNDIKEYCNDIYELKELDENGRWIGFDDYMKELRKESIKHNKMIFFNDVKYQKNKELNKTKD